MGAIYEEYYCIVLYVSASTRLLIFVLCHT